MAKIEANIAKEEPEVQWVMISPQVGLEFMKNSIETGVSPLGEKTGLYKGEMVSKGCTPNYLPEFMAIESNKRNL